MVNLRSVHPGEGGWFKAVTKFDEGELKIDPAQELGGFDYVWKDPQATWKVYSRVVPSGGDCTATITLFQPPVMTDAQFDQAMKEMDIEMAKLKEIMEK